jgi:TerC family integral membrane protein
MHALLLLVVAIVAIEFPVRAFTFPSRALFSHAGPRICSQQRRDRSPNEFGYRNSRTTGRSAVENDAFAEAKGKKTTQPDDALVLLKLEAEIEEEEDYVLSIKRTMVWVGAAVAFGAGLSYFDSPTTSEEFFAGYLLEQSLSIDNLLVFLLLFEYFRIPTSYQNRVLNWGIIGAIFMRAIMIGAGAVAIQQFHAVLLVFAAVLIYSSGKVLIGGDDDEDEDFSENMVVKFSNNVIQSTNKFDGDRFFTEEDGVRLATPMFLCMIAVELSDVVFAVDSIPAVFGVTEVSLFVF